MSTLATLACVRRSWDADAGTYLKSVEANDAQALDTLVAQAINQFVLACKRDGTWSAISTSCILMGARTLTGALTALKGSAPTNNNFVSGDYNRKTGLVGNGSTKWLNSNRATNAEGQNSVHLAVYKSTSTSQTNPYFLGANDSASVFTALGQDGIYARSTDSPTNIGFGLESSAIGLHGVSRSSSTAYSIKRPGSSLTTGTRTSGAVTASTNFAVFAYNGGGTPSLYSSSRFAFYSIGANIDLTLLNTAVSNLYTQIGNAIP